MLIPPCSPKLLISITKEAHVADARKRLIPPTADRIVARILKRVFPQ